MGNKLKQALIAMGYRQLQSQNTSVWAKPLGYSLLTINIDTKKFSTIF